MARLAACAAAALALGCPLARAAVGDDADLELAQVVVHSRHGARAPYLPGDDLPMQAHTKQTSGPIFETLNKTLDEQFGVPMAWLTKAGGVNVRNMGAYFRQHYIDTQAFPVKPGASCKDMQESMFFAANQSPRTLQTAGNFTAGFMPECKMPIWSNKTYVGALFNMGADTSKCPAIEKGQVLGLLGGKNGTYDKNQIEANTALIQEVSTILDCCQPEVCHAHGHAAPNSTECTLMAQPLGWTAKFFELFEGPLSTAAYWGEYFVLQYVNNNTDVAFNRIGTAVPLPAGTSVINKVLQYSTLQLASFQTSASFFSAQNFGSDLMTNLITTMEAVVESKNISGIPTAPQHKFVYYASHDLNLIFMRRLLNLNWYAKGWEASQTSLGGMLVFELHRSKTTKEYFVKVFYVAASPDQMREQVAFNISTGSEPWRAPVAVPGCSVGANNACPYATFRRLALAHLRPECMQVKDLQGWLAAKKDGSMGTQEVTEGSDTSSTYKIMAGVFGVACGLLLATVAYLLVRAKRERKAHNLSSVAVAMS